MEARRPKENEDAAKEKIGRRKKSLEHFQRCPIVSKTRGEPRRKILQRPPISLVKVIVHCGNMVALTSQIYTALSSVWRAFSIFFIASRDYVARELALVNT